MDIFKETSLWIIIIAIVIAGGIFVYRQGTFDSQVDPAIKIDDKVVSQSEFSQTIDQIVKEYETYGVPATSEDVFKQAKDRTIQETLLLNHAKDRDIKVSEEEIDNQYDEMMSMSGAENEEEFLAKLEEQGLQADEIDNLLEKQLKIEKLVDQYSDQVELEDGAIEDAYEDYKKQMSSIDSEQEIPSFEEMQSDLKQQLVQKKVQPLLLEKVEELKKDTDIEVLVEPEDFDIDIEQPDQPQMDMQMQPPQGENAPAPGSPEETTKEETTEEEATKEETTEESSQN